MEWNASHKGGHYTLTRHPKRNIAETENSAIARKRPVNTSPNNTETAQRCFLCSTLLD
jgi:hypothetical protein